MPCSGCPDRAVQTACSAFLRAMLSTRLERMASSHAVAALGAKRRGGADDVLITEFLQARREGRARSKPGAEGEQPRIRRLGSPLSTPASLIRQGSRSAVFVAVCSGDAAVDRARSAVISLPREIVLARFGSLVELIA